MGKMEKNEILNILSGQSRFSGKINKEIQLTRNKKKLLHLIECNVHFLMHTETEFKTRVFSTFIFV